MSSSPATGAAAQRPPKHTKHSAQPPQTTVQKIYDEQMAALSRARDKHVSSLSAVARKVEAAPALTEELSEERDAHPARLMIPEDPIEEQRLSGTYLKMSVRSTLTPREKRRLEFFYAIATTQADQSLSPFEKDQKIHFFRDRDWIQNNSELSDIEKQNLEDLLKLSLFQLIPFDPSFQKSVTAQISRMYGILEHWQMNEKELDDEDRQIKMWIKFSIRCCLLQSNFTPQQHRCIIDFLNNKFHIQNDQKLADEEKKRKIHLLIIEMIKSDFFPFQHKDLLIEFLQQRCSRLHHPRELSDEETREYDFLFRKDVGILPPIPKAHPSSPEEPSSPSLLFTTSRRANFREE